ncbi:MAG: DNA polymerase III subunit delta' [Acidiferrobacter sp.]
MLPWQRATWTGLAEASHLPHALLFCGPAGIGKRQFAERLSVRLVCERETACGTCRACHLASGGNHPDILVLRREEGKTEITVDQARALNEFLVLTPHLAPRRVALIADADHLNRSASNALLKTLEEPPAGNYLLLVSDSPARLLPTIRSRCQRIVLPRPTTEEGLGYLKERAIPDPDAMLALTHGAALQAEAWPRDTPALAARLMADLDAVAEGTQSALDATEAWHAVDLDIALSLLVDIAANLAQSVLAGAPASAMPAGWTARLRVLAGRLDLGQIFRLWDGALEARELAAAPLDRRLVWDRLFTLIEARL